LRKFPVLKEEDKSPFKETLGRLLKNKNYVMAVIAQFFYVGVQIGVWSFTIQYVMKNTDIISEDQASNYYLASIMLFSGSRFIFTWLMKYINPAKLLTLMSVLGSIATLIVVFIGGQTGAYALIGISGCMSLMFPTIYGIGLHGVGEDRKLGGSGMIMAIVGGAILTPIQAMVSDASTINLAYLIPLGCFVVIALYGTYAVKSGHR
ncbi:MAG: glucose/galactose MFS transporter, partial [Cyclobacteriaceae bacterium]|nr:glucose/galactose MFS transporter [Cyclobacteriaceae bacterium]